MDRKKGIIISLILSLVFTGAVIFSSNTKYAAATKTVEVAAVNQYIPAGKKITKDDIKMDRVPEKMAINLVQKADDVVGKTILVSLVKDQYIWKKAIAQGEAKKEGYIQVFIPTDLPSSACVIAGEVVDIYLVSKGGIESNSGLIYKGARVLNSLDQSGNEIDPARKNEVSQMAVNGSKVPVTVGVEVPEIVAPVIVQACSKKEIYLVKSNKLPKE
ncbi:SAF domain protein [Desulforamulus reducens MI-1]|uniref:SAF domain protein n=1 Tax=Desulforamulus reducens (strain ATCC BAA-1160 / DSM 100696 / MI-1) TaxID=349161 RepID=A4J331_DESRM|nr:SAF domain-containing protein [Desulforamulus reducens]ABO49484.1 SAF domain protein [Desulforamulus reducens MI-1]